MFKMILRFHLTSKEVHYTNKIGSPKSLTSHLGNARMSVECFRKCFSSLSLHTSDDRVQSASQGTSFGVQL